MYDSRSQVKSCVRYKFRDRDLHETHYICIDLICDSYSVSKVDVFTFCSCWFC